MVPQRPADLRRYYEAVAERAGHRCEYCLAPEVFFGFRFTLDHVVPKSRGGATSLANLSLCCPACQQQKQAFTMGWDSARQTVATLFDPRRQRWSAHFRWSADGLSIEGATAVGRATVGRLALNSPRQVAARSLWLKHPDLFP